jgi:hypothetical protein
MRRQVDLDEAFMQYCKLLGGTPRSLYREWKSGRLVLQQLNDLQVYHCTLASLRRVQLSLYILVMRDKVVGSGGKMPSPQGQDPEKIFQGIETWVGFNFLEGLVIALSKDNSRKVSAESVAKEWNTRVDCMLESATTDTERARGLARARHPTPMTIAWGTL